MLSDQLNSYSGFPFDKVDLEARCIYENMKKNIFLIFIFFMIGILINTQVLWKILNHSFKDTSLWIILVGILLPFFQAAVPEELFYRVICRHVLKNAKEKMDNELRQIQEQAEAEREKENKRHREAKRRFMLEQKRATTKKQSSAREKGFRDNP